VKIEMEAADLLSVVRGAAKSCAGRSINPILTGVKLTAEGDVVAAVGTDLNTASAHRGRCKAVRAGTCVLMQPGKLLTVLKEHGGYVHLSCDGEAVEVKLHGGKYKFPAANPDEFPDFPQADGKSVLAVPAPLLLRAVRQVSCAASRNENVRFALTGVLFEVADGALSLVATDTKRLHRAVVCPADAAWPDGLLVPSKTVGILEGVLLGVEGDVTLTASMADVRFEAGDWRLYSRLLEGKFPAWRSFVPKESDVRFVLDIAGFASATKRAAITSDAESNRVDYEFEPGRVSMSAKGAETGASEVEVEVPGCDGGLSVSFDPDYIDDAARACLEGGSAECVFRSSGARKPAVFEWEGGFALVMPISTE